MVVIMPNKFPSPEERHDWHTDRHGLDRQCRIAIAMIDLWVGVLIALLALASVWSATDRAYARPAACAGLSAAECGAAVAEGR